MVQGNNVKEAGSPLKVLVVGGSYGGLSAGLNLLDLCNGRKARFSQEAEVPEFGSRPKFPVQIKFVDERDGYYHLIGSPLAFASDDFAPKAWTRFEDLPALRAPGISWTQGSAVNVDCEKKVATIKSTQTGKEYEEDYDYLIAASGLRRTFPTVPLSFSREDYLAETRGHIKAVRDALEGVVVIGGGAVGIEMASEIKLIQPTQKVTLVHSREKLLSSEPLPDEFKDKSLELLRESGVEVILGQRATNTSPVEAKDESSVQTLTLSDGTQIKAGHVILAISHSVPTTTYLPQSALDKDGFVKIDAKHNFPSTLANSSSHFAIGDLVSWSGIKRCGSAMGMGYNSAVNIHQQLLQKHHGAEPKFVEFPEVPPMMGLAVGKKAVCFGGPNGVEYGEDMMKIMFGDDLGFSICWNYLQLSIDSTALPEEIATKKGKGGDVDVEVAVIDTINKLEAVTV